jgi:hypothetical protein
VPVQLFFILADLAWDSPEDPLSPGPKVLLKARLTADGNLELEPPVELSSTLTHLPTKPRRHIFHDHTGAIYEYSIFLKTGESSAERQLARQQALWREHEQAHIERVAKKQMAKFKHLARATLFVWLEIVSGAGFAHDRVYVEFALCYPKSAWKLRGPSWVLEQQAATGCKDNDGDTVHVRLGSSCFTQSLCWWLHSPQSSRCRKQPDLSTRLARGSADVHVVCLWTYNCESGMRLSFKASEHHVKLLK